MADNSTFTSGFGKILENILRPSYGGNEVLRNTLASMKGAEDFKPVESFAKGFKLEKKTTGTEVLDEAIGSAPEDATPAGKIARGIAGFLVDVFADPTTYVGIGGLTKAGKIADIATSIAKAGKIAPETKIGKLAQEIAAGAEHKALGSTALEQANRGQRAVITFGGKSLLGNTADKAIIGMAAQAKNVFQNAPVIRDFINAGEKLFSTKTGIKELDVLLHKFRGNTSKIAEDLVKQVEEIRPLLKQIPKSDLEKIQQYIVRNEVLDPKTGAALTLEPKQQEVAEKIIGYFKNIADMETEKKVLEKTIDGYLPGVITEEALKLAKKLKPKMDANEFSKRIEFNEEKILTRHLTASEANRVIREAVRTDVPIQKIQDEIVKTLNPEQIASLEGIRDMARAAGVKDIKKFFHDDLDTLMAVRGIKSARAIAQKDFVDQAKRFGLTKEQFRALPADQKLGMSKVAVEGMGDLLFPRRVANALNRFNEAMVNPRELNDLVAAWRTSVRWWKMWTLSIFPEYHARNLVGNFWNNWVSVGLKEPQYYLDAGKVQSLSPKFRLKVKGTGEELDAAQILNELKERGVIDSGQLASETAETLQERFAGPTLNPLKAFTPQFGPLYAGRKVGDKLENNAKIAHYLFQRGKGFSADDAAMSVKEALFDYQDLTPFEQKWMRQIMPFYSWSRKNIPLQLKQLIAQPERYARIGKAKQEYEYGAGTKGSELKWMPEWMRESFPIIISKLPEGERYKVLLLTSWLPAGDIDRLFDPGTFITSSIEPFSKEIAQQLTNRDFFLQKEIEAYPGEEASALGMDVPVRVRHVLRMFRLLNYVDQLNPGGVFGVEGGKPSWAGAKRKITDLTGEEKVAKGLFGVKLYPLDIQKAKTSQQFTLRKQLRVLQTARKKEAKAGDMKAVERITEKINKLNQKLRTGE